MGLTCVIDPSVSSSLRLGTRLLSLFPWHKAILLMSAVAVVLVMAAFAQG